MNGIERPRQSGGSAPRNGRSRRILARSTLALFFSLNFGCEKTEFEKEQNRQKAKAAMEELRGQLQHEERITSEGLLEIRALLKEIDEDLARLKTGGDPRMLERIHQLEARRAPLLKEVGPMQGHGIKVSGQIQREIDRQEVLSRQGANVTGP